MPECSFPTNAIRSNQGVKVEIDFQKKFKKFKFPVFGPGSNVYAIAMAFQSTLSQRIHVLDIFFRSYLLFLKILVSSEATEDLYGEVVTLPPLISIPRSPDQVLYQFFNAECQKNRGMTSQICIFLVRRSQMIKVFLSW